MSKQAFKQSFSNLLSYGNPLSHSLARSQLLNRFGEDALEFVAVAVDVTVAVSVDASILFILVLCGIFMLFIYKSIHICLCMKYVHTFVYLLKDVCYL